MNSAVLLAWLEAFLPPLAFLLVLWALWEPKCSRRTALGAALGFLAADAAVQGAIFALSQSRELVFTLLPLTFYLPAILGLHLLSKNRFLPTALIWLLGVLGSYLLTALGKLLDLFTAHLGGPVWGWVCAAVLFAAAAALAVLAYRGLRPPFLNCAKELEGNRGGLLFLPVMVLALWSYALNSTTNVTVLILLFLTALAAVLVLTRLFASLAEARRARDARQQMAALQKDYELLQKKLAMGRVYRHDTRHHLTALAALLQEENYQQARRYMADWQGQLAQFEAETWCRNAAVNAVLSAYLAQAKEIGCALEAEVSLPESFPFDDLDLCVVLSNALENAVRACEAEPEGLPRKIRLALALTDRRLTLRVENSCHKAVVFDDDGFPAVRHREGHGQGLRSIAAVAEKYHGLFQCDWEEGVFTLRVVLLDGAPGRKSHRSHRAPTVCAGVFLGLFLLNCMPSLVQALESVPVLGQLVRVVDLRTWSLGWGDTGIAVREPVLEGPAVEELDAQKEAFIAEMEEKFLWYAARKYRGYVAEDITYEVTRDNEELFILRFSATLNAGGSVDYRRCLVLDKGTGKVLELADLFLPEVNYVFPISREIEAQMAEQIKAGTGDYFLPGGIWSDEECFRSIAEDQEFTVNGDGQLVILFAEYEVAPGSMGAPEFVIPTDVLDGLLAQPSVLR